MSILRLYHNPLVHTRCACVVAVSLFGGFSHVQLWADESPDSAPLKVSGDEAEVSEKAKSVTRFVLPGANADTQKVDAPAEGSNTDEAVYVLPEFTVSSEQDRGYYSANALAGSRTNQAIKDTPMTISVVNQELIGDLNLDDIDSLEQVVASAQAEGEDYSNNALRFRGLLTRSQLYEFVPRLGGQKGYNVERAEIIRGANTLVYGQASPGGKVNFLGKRAQFDNDKIQFGFQSGTYDLAKGNIDFNKQLSDAFAIRVLGYHEEKESERDYEAREYDGVTLAVTYRPTTKTSFGFHAEVYDEFRNSPPGMYKDQTGEYGLTGIYRNLPATPDVVDFLSDAAMQQIIDYKPVNYKKVSWGDGIQRHPTPQVNIQSREDLKTFYGTITPDNVGTIAGGDPEFNRDGHFFLGDVTHQFTDALSLKVALAHEEANVDRLTRTQAANLRLSAQNKTLVRLKDEDGNYTFPPGFHEPNKEVYYDGSDPATMPSPYVVMGWEAVTQSDKSNVMRSTLSWDKEVFGTKQRILLGFDYDRREATELVERLVMDSATQNPDGTYNTFTASLFDRVLVNDFNRGDHSAIDYNQRVNISGNFNPNTRISGDLNNNNNLVVAGDLVGESGTGFFKYRDRDSSVDTQAIWLAAQGNYMDGRLNTLFGVRFDTIHLTAVGRQIAAGTGSDVDERYKESSPTLGALFWLNKHVGVFANYAQSIESPTGWQLTPTGETIPAELGTGIELGAKFELLDGLLSGQLTFFQIDKENDNLTRYSKQQLERLYPEADYPELWVPGPWGTSFQPIGTNVGGIVTRSEGAELDLYYNPSRELSFFLGYAYTDAFFQSGPKDTLGNTLVEYGDRVPGTAHHSANLTVRYSFKGGKLKGWFAGTNLRYRSKSYFDELFADVGTNGEGVGFYDGRADILPLVDENGVPYPGGDPKSFELWLSDTFRTSAFVGWGGQLKKGKGAPYFKFQLSVDNIFDARDLIATGRNARYTPGRSGSFKLSVNFK